MKYLTDIRSVLLKPVQINTVCHAKKFGSLTLCCVFVCVLLSISNSAVQANSDVGIILVSNIDTDLSSIDDTEIRRLFLGKSRRLPNGDRAALAAYAPSTTFFNSRVLGQSDTAVARIWSKLKFSGRQPPPRSFDSVEAVLAYVKSTPNALAYLPSTYRGDDVRVMMLIPGDAPSLR